MVVPMLLAGQELAVGKDLKFTKKFHIMEDTEIANVNIYEGDSLSPENCTLLFKLQLCRENVPNHVRIAIEVTLSMKSDSTITVQVNFPNEQLQEKKATFRLLQMVYCSYFINTNYFFRITMKVSLFEMTLTLLLFQLAAGKTNLFTKLRKKRFNLLRLKNYSKTRRKK